MNVSLNLNSVRKTSPIREELSELLTTAFWRFRARVLRINFTVRDVNGPRGGVDKQACCVLYVKGMSPIVINDRDQSVVNLVNRVTDRAVFTLSEKVSRVKRRMTHNRPLSETADRIDNSF